MVSLERTVLKVTGFSYRKGQHTPDRLPHHLLLPLLLQQKNLNSYKGFSSRESPPEICNLASVVVANDCV